jgi:site-specific DNA-methyltransferase (adenine-specific)
MIRYYADDFVELWHGDIRDGLPASVAAGSVACTVTSPPYNVGLDYDVHDDAIDWHAYFELQNATCAEVARLTCPAGRVWVNAAVFVPARPPRSADDVVGRVNVAQHWNDALVIAGFWPRDWIAWTSNRQPDTAWGSWESPSAPNLRGGWEAIVVASKGAWRREPPAELDAWHDAIGGWAPLTTNVWAIRPERRIEHPAPFPVELPSRCIRLSTWPDEVVLDPFAGTGTTLVAARALGRRSIGVELSERYCEIAARRLAQGCLEFGGAA